TARARVVAGLVILVVGSGLVVGVPYVPSHDRAQSTGGGPGGSGSVTNVTINATDAPSFVPAEISVVAGSVVSFEVVNVGNFTHTFTLSRTANATFDPHWTPSQLDAFFRANGSFANLTVAPGTTGFTNVSIPQSAAQGSFEFASVVPYQFQAGMAGYLNVSSGASGPSVPLATGGTNSLSWVPNVLAIANATNYPISVSVALRNLGQLGHTFAVESTPGVNLSANFTTYFTQHPPLADVVLPTSGGAVAYANFTINAKGVYEFICTVPGHFIPGGMFGFLYVGVAPPAAAAPPSTALVQEGVLVAGGALLGIGVILALAAAYTGRFPRSGAPPSTHP
ncbi:MAG: hypothetical protein ACREDK_07305, partial [Thermoplasmata archaeon]